jgi:hypothetical protein
MINAPLAGETALPAAPAPLAAPETPVQPAPVALNQPETAEFPPPLPQIASGEVPAVLVPPITPESLEMPVVASIVENFGRMAELGIEFYEAADLSTVLYNPEKVTVESLKEAEANGTLGQLAVPLDAAASALPEALAAEQPAAAPLQGVKAPANSRLTTARMRNIAPKQVSPIQPNPLEGQLGKRAL